MFYLVCDCVNGECDSGILGFGSCDCYLGWNGDRCDEGNDIFCWYVFKYECVRFWYYFN